MSRWENRQRKEEAKRKRMRKHGRSIVRVVKDTTLRRRHEARYTGVPHNHND